MDSQRPLIRPQRFDGASSGRLRFVLVVLSICIGLIKLWPWRYATVADGISYLDIAGALTRGQWKELFNTYWGPVLPTITAIAMEVPRANPFVALHLALALGYTLCVVAFAVFWTGARSYSNASIGRVYPRLWLLAGFTLFLLSFIPQVPNETPDLFVSAAVFLVAAILLRACENHSKSSDGLFLGLAAGLGYWAKSVMYPLGWLAVLMFGMLALRRKEYLRAFSAVVAFLVITTPLVIGISANAGRFTFGTSGQLNYAWIVDQNAHSTAGANFFNGGQRVFDSPVVYQYPVKYGVSFAPWYDPGKADNSKANFSLSKQGRALKTSSKFLRTLFLSEHAPLLLCVFFLGALEPKRFSKALFGRLPALIFALAGLAIYALVILIYRYIVPFEVVLWGTLLGAASIDSVSALERRVSTAALIGAMGLILLNEAGGLATVLLDFHNTQGLDQIRVAESLKRDGIRGGDRVAVIGRALTQGWPHLTNSSIAFEIPVDSADAFSQASAAHRQEIFATIHSAGVRFVISCVPTPSDSRFKKIDGTECSYLKE